MKAQSLNIDPVLRVPEVLALTGARSRQTIYNWMEKGTFPKPIKIGPNSIGWLKSECDAWKEQLLKDREVSA
ncbi:TPA: helix-turn-helix transcriptional regulator [Vibrio alginolyticus]|uniref:helix-turn-helix transcriptional regulator n=1 Tax=Vibrio alginolyticus TaxID=663 RepID=UPI00215FEDA6|nr:AlpA family transcriptional regulator [Vibrio alginolyticus]MCS0223030.1 AlpA family transcriptional regulator [Vibrio alginolyticus]HCH5916176.1 AlpA family transcriptional regulator [Vibrio parahaemolyticus]HCH5920524.1 AlpA family transcriptional regulator [Vibrio parahaemolyticus]